jgi:hypothetical protein
VNLVAEEIDLDQEKQEPNEEELASKVKKSKKNKHHNIK